MKKLKLYLETSVWNFMFADDSPDKMTKTINFFKDVESGKYEIYISELVLAEFDKSEGNKQVRLKGLIERCTPFELEADENVTELIEKYLSAKIVPEKYENDVIHIAFAVAHDMDVVVSWNLKHIVKLKTKLSVNGINKMLGYKEIELCTPEEVMEDDE